MKEKSAILFLCLAGIFCFIICLLTGYSSLNGGIPQFFSPPAFLENGTSLKSESSEGEKTDPGSSESQNTSSYSSEIPAASNGQALGAIKKTFFSAGSAGLNLNNVQINNKTDTPINILELLKTEIPFKIETGAPQVLILHTHTTESYMPYNRDYYTATDSSHSNDETKNMIAIGTVFERKLNAAGIKAIHSKVVHDYPSYSGSYDKSAETINAVLKEHKSVKVVLDLHRDSIADGSGGKIKPVTQIGGKNAAQVMLVMGNNFSSWKNNFSLAARFHQTMQVMYPGLARPISLYNKKYNQNLSNGAMLIEIGTDANTLDEALYGAQLAANALICLLNTLK